MDGEHQIMISEALNDSDRLSSCNKSARKVMESQAGPFHVYVFQAGGGGAAHPEGSTLRFNLGGIRMNEAPLRKLEPEISLVPPAAKPAPLRAASDQGQAHLLRATRPVRPD